MKTKRKNRLKDILLPVVPALLILGFSCAFLLKGETRESLSERRMLAQFPEISKESLSDGSFMTDFESYSLDQFPARDTMRTLKALGERFLFFNPVSNDFYLVDGHIVKTEYPQKDEMLAYAAKKLTAVYDGYIAPVQSAEKSGPAVYLSVIPDKGAFLAQKKGVPAMDYEKFISDFTAQMPSAMTYIDLFPYLSADDYYRTDPHWRQEKITDAANALSEAMAHRGLSGVYEEVTPDAPFYGAYSGQSALPVKPDRIRYLKNDVLSGCTVKTVDEKTGFLIDAEMYSATRAAGRDPYELFLCGASPVVIVENPNAKEKRELVLFRDSFGSSIAPLLAESYSKITLIDTRYMEPRLIPHFVDFSTTDDVLFLYSTLILNSSVGLR